VHFNRSGQFLERLFVKITPGLLWIGFYIFKRQPENTRCSFNSLRLQLSGRIFQVRVDTLEERADSFSERVLFVCWMGHYLVQSQWFKVQEDFHKSFPGLLII